MSSGFRQWRRGWLEALLLAVLAFGPFLLTSQVAANGSWWVHCNGRGIGSYCASITDDPTVCQDCAQWGCDFSCTPGVYSSQQYLTCIQWGFTICLGA